MTNDTLLAFCFPAVSRKKVTAAFDGSRITSDGGVMLRGAWRWPTGSPAPSATRAIRCG